MIVLLDEVVNRFKTIMASDSLIAHDDHYEYIGCHLLLGISNFIGLNIRKNYVFKYFLINA